MRVPLRIALPVVAMLVAACSTPNATAPASPSESPGESASDRSPSATASAAGAETEAPLASITHGYTVNGTVYWELFIADELGYFEDENLEVELTLINNPAQLVTALVGGSVDSMSVAVDTAIRAKLEGAPIVGISGGANNAVQTLVVAPGIDSYEDLRGKKISTTALGTGSTLLLQKMLSANGLEDGDYELVVGGSGGERQAALESGAVDAASLTQPFDFVSEANGYTILDYSDSVIPAYELVSTFADSNFAEENRDTVVRFVRAQVRAWEWFADPANRDEAISLMVELTGQEEELIAKTYDLYHERDVLTADGFHSEEGVAEVISLMEEAGAFEGAEVPEPSFIFDRSFVEDAR